MTLKTALEALEAQKPGILLSDGAETWAVPNLLDAMRDGIFHDGASESDREVAIVHAGGRATVQPVTDGYVGTGEPLYLEVEAA